MTAKLVDEFYVGQRVIIRCPSSHFDGERGSVSDLKEIDGVPMARLKLDARPGSVLRPWYRLADLEPL